ncbi:MAG: chromosomal replication initiator protein DnaA [Acidimicrobiia bacterium]|nr:chromosomal replication initiator protein DnaA [Acidimicrobiia bacterium]
MWIIDGQGETVVYPHPTEEDEWDRFKAALHGSVSEANWATWLSALKPDRSANAPTLLAPSEFHLRWVQDKHGRVIKSAFTDVFGGDSRLTFAVSPPDSHGDEGSADALDEFKEKDSPLPDALAPQPGSDTENPSLIQRYRFETFVVGQSNRFAWAASMAVAEQPGTHYNPLFIYGAAGLGKTHLLNAVGHHTTELYSGARVRYVTSENFLNEFIDGIRRKRIEDFKHRYRSVDVLLLDDIQFLEGKEQILEEFFHTFNTLYESGKQMVISSDRHPRNLATLEDRLRSRFEWGLLTDIQPPDVETRLAILRRNAEANPQAVPIEVLEHIATLVSDNIRELEGALTRVTAWAALTDTPIELQMAREVLRDLHAANEPKTIYADDIIVSTATACGFSVDDLTGPSRRQPLVLARQIAMYLCREHTDLSLPRIGSHFGGRDHTTVIHSIEKVKRVMQTDREVFDRVSELTKSLRGR